MKIVQINQTYGDADSTGRSTKELHEWLLVHGHDSNAFVLKSDKNFVKTENGGVHLFSSWTDRKLHAFLSRLTGLQGYFSRNSTKQLIRRMKDINPQVVLLRILHSNCINMPMLVRYLSSNHIAVILILHDCWYFTGHCCYYTDSKCEKWMKDCDGCSQIHEWNKSWVFDTAKKCLWDKQKWFSSIEMLGVIGVSKWITNEAKNSILQDKAIIRDIYNWIDFNVFYPRDTKIFKRELGIQNGLYILLGVASYWGDRKGIQEILLVAEELSEAKIILVGKISRTLRLPENVICVGTVKETDLLAKYYSMADVFLNPSVQETFGKTTAEAICCGTPVVAYETTACTELIRDGCGKLVPLGDKESYLKTVKDILDEGKETYYLNCLKFSHKNFDQDKNILEYIAFMQELLGEERKDMDYENSIGV